MSLADVFYIIFAEQWEVYTEKNKRIQVADWWPLWMSRGVIVGFSVCIGINLENVLFICSSEYKAVNTSAWKLCVYADCDTEVQAAVLLCSKLLCILLIRAT